MTIEQSFLAHDEFTLCVEYHKVCVVARSDSAFAYVAVGKLCRAFRHPANNIRQRKSPSARFGVHQRKRHRKTCNAAPCGLEVALRKPLHLRRTGRVVGHHEIDGSVTQSYPQFFEVFTTSYWRSTLEKS